MKAKIIVTLGILAIALASAGAAQAQWVKGFNQPEPLRPLGPPWNQPGGICRPALDISDALDVVARARLWQEGAALVESVMALFLLLAIFLGFYFLLGWAA